MVIAHEENGWSSAPFPELLTNFKNMGRVSHLEQPRAGASEPPNGARADSLADMGSKAATDAPSCEPVFVDVSKRRIADSGFRERR
jgi:hypothetical protein